MEEGFGLDLPAECIYDEPLPLAQEREDVAGLRAGDA